MIPRGTKVEYNNSIRTEIINSFREFMTKKGFVEIEIPSISYQSTFVKKAGEEVLKQMYTFKDKSGRDLCLIPEVTGVIQDLWDEGFFNSEAKPVKIFYVSRCYRYEKPQAGRYREFLQAGIEILGGADAELREARGLLCYFLNSLGINYKFEPAVKRGLSYYISEGFEATCESLGAQKQIAGGGAYKQGVGWAIGVDRLVLALDNSKKK